uniref:Uncharacterized protein n=1 Tax=Anguilla anguilla TaxID=7936 RepID=A0A0E9QEI9_ANGAN
MYLSTHITLHLLADTFIQSRVQMCISLSLEQLENTGSIRYNTHFVQLFIKVQTNECLSSK